MYNPYMPYNNPYLFQSKPDTVAPGTRQEIVRVNGENGANALILAPNSSALVLDTTAPIVWLCQTDGAGYKTITPYSITPYEKKPEIDLSTLENRIAKLEEKVNGNKPDTISA